MKKETIKIDFNKKDFKINVLGFGFKEGNNFIIYLPSLNISGYGKNKDEALEMIKISLDAFSDDLFEMGPMEAQKYLEKLGWKPHPVFHKKLERDAEVSPDLLKKQYHLPKDTPIQQIPIAV